MAPIDCVEELNKVARCVVSEDGLRATLSAPPLPELRDITKEEIESFLRRQGITHGLCEEGLAHTCAALRLGKPAEEVLVARGTAAQPACGEDFQLCFDPDTSAGTVLEDGRIDYRERNSVIQVRGGDTLCLVKPSTEGAPGRTVTGKAIPPPRRGGRPLPKAGKNVSFDREGGRYMAEVSGAVTFHHNVLSVTTQLTIPGDVDYRVGNVRFTGDVLIRGSVRARFSVEVEGSLVILGGIEPKARITAKGDITIEGICRGCGKKGPVTVRGEGTVTLGAVEDAVVTTEGDILLRKHVLGSTLCARGTVKALGPEARIRASYVEGVRGLELHTVGSPTAKPTYLAAGITAQIAEKIQHLEEQIQSLTARLNAICEAFYKRYEPLLMTSRLTEEEREELARAKEEANARQQDLDRKIHDLRRERAALAQHLRQDPHAACVVLGTVYPVTFVQLHDNRYVLRGDARSNVVLYRLNGRVVCHTREDYERYRREAEADPDGLMEKLTSGKLNEAALIDGLERYIATLDSVIMRTAVAVGLKAVRQKRYQNAATWTLIAWGMALVARRVAGGTQREKLLTEAHRAAQSALALRSAGPGAYAAFGLIAYERDDLSGALASFREAVRLAERRGRRRSLAERDDAVFPLFSYLLHRVSGRLTREGHTAQAETLRAEGYRAAQEYLRRYPRGPWAALAQDLSRPQGEASEKVKTRSK